MKIATSCLLLLVAAVPLHSQGWVNGEWVDPSCAPPYCWSLPPIFAVTIHVATPVLTIEQAWALGGDAVVSTSDAYAPYVVVTAHVIAVHPASEAELQWLVDDYVRSLTAARPFLVQWYSNRDSAERDAQRLRESSSFFSETWIADSSSGGAFLVYGNPQ